MEWLPDEKFNKYVGILRLQYNQVMQPFKMYGLDAFIPGAIDELIKLAVRFSEVTRGKDKPISIDDIRKRRKK